MNALTWLCLQIGGPLNFWKLPRGTTADCLRQHLAERSRPGVAASTLLLKWVLPKSGALLRSPYNEDHLVYRSILGFPVYVLRSLYNEDHLVYRSILGFPVYVLRSLYNEDHLVYRGLFWGPLFIFLGVLTMRIIYSILGSTIYMETPSGRHQADLLLGARSAVLLRT